MTLLFMREEYEKYFPSKENFGSKNIAIGALILAAVSLGSLGYYSYNLKSNLDSLNSKYIQAKKDLKYKATNLENKLGIIKKDYSNSTEQILKDENKILDLINEKEDLKEYIIDLEENNTINSKNLTDKLSKLTTNYNQLKMDYNSTNSEYEIKLKKLKLSNAKLGKYLTLVFGSCGREITSLNKKNSNLTSNYKKLYNYFDFLKKSKDNLSNKLDICNKNLESKTNINTSKIKLKTNYLKVKKDSNVWNTSKDEIIFFNLLKNNNLFDRNLIKSYFNINNSNF